MAKAKTLIALAEGENIPLNQLRLSEDNVRKTFTKEAIADMAKDIRTNGLIQSLSVRKLAEAEGIVTHEVQGGGRRFRALQLLVQQKELAEDTPIPTVPNEKQIAAQISLAENVQREALNPIDEYRAYAAMKEQGKSEEDIAAANRVSVHVVKQRLRLGTASPVLHKAFLDEKLTLSNLMAFCVTDDKERQEQVWKELKSQSYLNTWTIKQKLMENTVPTSDRRVKFVGLKAYENAGGRVEPDLFAEDHASYILDVALLNQLAQAKLDRAAEKVKAQGWAWAMTGVDIPYETTSAFGQITAENEERTEQEEEQLQALEAERDQIRETPKDERSKKQVKRLEDLNAEIDALENPEPIYNPEDMARAGATVEIDSSGKLMRSLDHTTIDLKKVERGDPMTIYIVLPPDKLLTHGKLLRLWLTLLLNALSKRETRPAMPTLLIVDEAAQLGEMKELKSAITLMRGYGMKVWTFWQDLTQLQALYPDDWPTIVNNCAVHQYFGVSTPMAARTLQDYLGDTCPRPVASLKPNHLALYRPGEKGSVVRTPNYLTDAMFQGMFDANPFYASRPDLALVDEQYEIDERDGGVLLHFPAREQQ